MRKPSLDYIFLFSVIALTAVGAIMVFSASPTMALKLGDSYFYLKKHILHLLFGFGALYLALRMDLGVLRKWSVLILGISVLLLLLVFLPGVGKTISGASRWIDLMIFSFQPSELLKFTSVLFLANLLAKSGKKIEDLFFGLLPALTFVGVISALIIAQPDLGTAIVIAGTAYMMFFAAGAKIIHLTLLGIAGIAGAVGLSLTSPYRLNRVIAFIDPWKDPQGVGFHIVQSLLAVGSGGLFGLGLGASRQKFFYLPQQFTDFIFAILCEELGFMGGVGVVALFLMFAARGFRIAFMVEDKFNSLLAVGLISWITLQAIVNIMVVLGLLPTTGIPLPFISYGGTATIIGLFATGIVLNISKEQR